MRISQSDAQRSKAAAHAVQTFAIFITGCLALSVLTKDGETGVQVEFMFGLVSLNRYHLL